LIKMRKLLIVLFIIILAFSTLNIKVNTIKGINYQWYTLKIPLYLKLLDFFDRHYNYEDLVVRITEGLTDQKDKVTRIFDWTYNNIRRVPAGFPVIDDHVWNIIVRGYGADDQLSDVFTTLCNYAGIDAFYSLVYTPDQASAIPISFVKINGKWYIFDPYRGTLFRNPKRELIDIESIRLQKNWLADSKISHPELDYRPYLDNLETPKEVGLRRANIQSPFRRLIYELKKWIPFKK